ncbi:E3 ubiquitin-protein ligase TRIM71-like [Acanthaster planci]|uniref:E3 ubiquitin-protein ligase TRIM71-like n=1 Tax=Acanthaster planci TaxID=133434 RepID=A0A8B7ZTE9_ACAPL|nr:E3 ubiquitin-protein ligase TRIM71-like [Acanthaster planci]
MATSVTVQSLLEKISGNHLECSICTLRFKQPRVLDCLHNFCLPCLQDMLKGQKQCGLTLDCPLCRQGTLLKGKILDDLPTNFTLTALVEEVTMMERLINEGQGSEIKCQGCDEGNGAISVCRNCDHFLCPDCHRAHERMTVMKSHHTDMLAQLQTGEVAYKSKLREQVPKCGKHPDQNLSFYCDTCEQLVCTTCSVLDHGSKTHVLVDLPKALEKCKQEVAKLVAKAEQNKAELDKAIQQNDKSGKKLDAMFDDTRKEIDRKAGAQIWEIKNEAQELKQELKKAYEDRFKAFKTAEATNSKEVTLMEQKLDEVDQRMTQASCYEILNLKKQLLHNVKELTKRQPQRVSDKLAILGLAEDQRLLGRLSVGNESILQRCGRLCKTLCTSTQYQTLLLFVLLFLLFQRLFH